MKLLLANIAIVLTLSIMLHTEVCRANPLGNRWYPTDPRCDGGSHQGIRWRRYVTSNNFAQASYRFNPNHGSCERAYGRSSLAFDSRKECEAACLDVYHFS